MRFFRKKTTESFEKINAETVADDFATPEKKTCRDPYLNHAWVSVCVDILSRNVGRADFEIQCNGKKNDNCPVAKLFAFPNKTMSSYEICALLSINSPIKIEI